MRAVTSSSGYGSKVRRVSPVAGFTVAIAMPTASPRRHGAVAGFGDPTPARVRRGRPARVAK
ncbi:hypothetical protein NUM_36020 [Actinocatenispora comari]|uniref:Uncharacterized protein n=1 Tax=Actinocatenispora comari TaxID=2807577 RepID=A0A8J4AC98_9ACTN|nr:hypothetical protein NUM_36020 [Actinocatenispora comari]